MQDINAELQMSVIRGKSSSFAKLLAKKQQTNSVVNAPNTNPPNIARNQ